MVTLGTKVSVGAAFGSAFPPFSATKEVGGALHRWCHTAVNMHCGGGVQTDVQVNPPSTPAFLKFI